MHLRIYYYDIIISVIPQCTPSAAPRRDNLVMAKQVHTLCKPARLYSMPKQTPVSCSEGQYLCAHILIWFSVLVKGLEGKKIVQIACGQQHSVALDDEGYASYAIQFVCAVLNDTTV